MGHDAATILDTDRVGCFPMNQPYGAMPAVTRKNFARAPSDSIG